MSSLSLVWPPVICMAVGAHLMLLLCICRALLAWLHSIWSSCRFHDSKNSYTLHKCKWFVVKGSRRMFIMRTIINLLTPKHFEVTINLSLRPCVLWSLSLLPARFSLRLKMIQLKCLQKLLKTVKLFRVLVCLEHHCLNWFNMRKRWWAWHLNTAVEADHVEKHCCWGWSCWTCFYIPLNPVIKLNMILNTRTPFKKIVWQGR